MMHDMEESRRQKDEFFRSSHHSPLLPEQKADFHGLRYFPPNPELELAVEVERFPQADEVLMQTNTGDVQRYTRFGRFTFQVGDEEAALTIYRNENGYFLPFTDSLAGTATYGAGRDLEPELLTDGRFAVDFKLAYN